MKQLPTQKNEMMKCLRSIASSAVPDKLDVFEGSIACDDASLDAMDAVQPAGPNEQTVKNILAYARALDVLRPGSTGPVLVIGN